MDRYTIQIDLAGPIVAPAFPLLLDSILAYALVARETKGEILSPCGYDAIIDSLPLRKIPYGDSYFYAASELEVLGTPMSAGTMPIRRITTYARFCSLFGITDDVIRRLAGNKVTKETYMDRGNSVWKVYDGSLDLMYCDGFRCVLDTDKIDDVMSLLRSLTHIGKKRSVGLGLIAQIHDPIKDSSAAIVRPVPLNAGYEVTAPIVLQRLKPPYYKAHDQYVAGKGRI